MADSTLTTPDAPIPQSPDYSLFSQKAIDVAAFIGGPFAGTLLVSLNYHRLGQTTRRNQAILGGLLATLLLFWILSSIPSSIIEKIPSFAFSVINVGLVHLATSKLLDKRLAHHYESGGKKASNWSTTGFSLLGLCVTIACLLLYLPMINPYDFEGEVTKFGNQKNEIYHPKDLPEKVVADFAVLLTEAEYFNDEYQTTAQIKALPNSYEVSLAFIKDYWNDPELYAYLREFEQTLETELGTNVELYLVDEDLRRTYRESIDNIHIPQALTPKKQIP